MVAVSFISGGNRSTDENNTQVNYTNLVCCFGDIFKLKDNINSLIVF
jgi:hypothetical protein